MILKVLLVVGIIVTVYFLFFKQRDPNKLNEKKTSTPTNDMVECSECGIYCDLQESLLSNGKQYCSQECMEKK